MTWLPTSLPRSVTNVPVRWCGRAVVRRDEEAFAEPRPGPRISVRHVTFAVVVVMVLAGAMGFWKLDLRTAAAGYAQAAVYRGETLRILADGARRTVEAADEVAARVVVDGENLAFTARGLPVLAAGERLEVWLTTAEGPLRALEPVRAT